MNDASQALKTNPEKTEEALQKVLPIPPPYRNKANPKKKKKSNNFKWL